MAKWANLAERLNITEEQAETVIDLAEGRIQAENFDRFPRTYTWIRQCYHRPSDVDIALSAIDEVLETFGVEGWAGPGLTRGVAYANTGDGDHLTVCLVDGEFRISSYNTLETREGWRKQA